MKCWLTLIFSSLGILVLPPVIAVPCSNQEAAYLQVLGSGGPELTADRASSAYLVWQDKQARILIDAGGGSALRFSASGANIIDLNVVLFTHFHVDHTADFPAMIKASFFTQRTRDLPVFGPTGNRLLPSTTDFIDSLFLAKNGVWPYLNGYLPGGDEAYHLKPKNIPIADDKIQVAYEEDDLKITAIPTQHGPLPSLAWRIETKNKSFVFSGDMNGNRHTLEILARNADILVAHNAIPETAKGGARNLHMPPSVIGKIAAKANVKKLVLSHRMRRTLGIETSTLKEIRKHYSGSVLFADDLSCYSP